MIDSVGQRFRACYSLAPFVWTSCSRRERLLCIHAPQSLGFDCSVRQCFLTHPLLPNAQGPLWGITMTSDGMFTLPTLPELPDLADLDLSLEPFSLFDTTGLPLPLELQDQSSFAALEAHSQPQPFLTAAAPGLSIVVPMDVSSDAFDSKGSSPLGSDSGSGSESGGSVGNSSVLGDGTRRGARVSGGVGAGPRSRKRPRDGSRFACARCFLRKLSCDGERSCGRCASAGAACTDRTDAAMAAAAGKPKRARASQVQQLLLDLHSHAHVPLDDSNEDSQADLDSPEPEEALHAVLAESGPPPRKRHRKAAASAAPRPGGSDGSSKQHAHALPAPAPAFAFFGPSPVSEQAVH